MSKDPEKIRSGVVCEVWSSGRFREENKCVKSDGLCAGKDQKT